MKVFAVLRLASLVGLSAPALGNDISLIGRSGSHPEVDRHEFDVYQSSRNVESWYQKPGRTSPPSGSTV